MPCVRATVSEMMIPSCAWAPRRIAEESPRRKSSLPRAATTSKSPAARRSSRPRKAILSPVKGATAALPAEMRGEEEPRPSGDSLSEVADRPGKSQECRRGEQGAAQNEQDQRDVPEERGAADGPLPRRPVGPAEKQEAEEREEGGPPAVWTGQPWIKGFSHGEPPCMKTGVQRGEK